MKDLILMRHAQAEPSSLKIRDFDRGLTLKGEKDAAKIAHYLQKHFKPIDVIFASNSKRTSDTATIVNRAAGASLQLVESFYHANAFSLREFIETIDDKFNVVLLVCHNPAVSILSGMLAKENIEMKPSDIMIVKLKNKSWAKILEVDASFHKSVH